MSKQFRIGLQINSIDSDYSKGLIDGVTDYCRENDIALIIFSGRAIGWPYDYGYQNAVIFEHIHGGNIDALVIATGTQCNFISIEEFSATLTRLGTLPLVSLSIPLPNVPCVVVDNEIGFQKLLTHLVDVHLCTRIALLKGPEDNAEANRRHEVYKFFLIERGLEYNPEIVFYGDFSAEYSLKSVKRHLDTHALDFDVLVCLNDSMAIGCLHYFDEIGIRVPEDVLVTGFDDIIRSRYEIPSLTTINQDLENQGQLAARYAHEICLGEKVPLLTTLQTKPMFRQSCGCVEKDQKGYFSITEDNIRIQAVPKYSRTAGIGWFRIQDDVVKLRQYLSHLISVLSVSDLVADLRSGLESFGIKSCAIVIFGEEILNGRSDSFILPDRAEMILSYDESVSRESVPLPIAFNPRTRIIPEGTFSGRKRRLVASSLFHRGLQLGYILFEPGDCDSGIYETLCVQLSSSIRSALVFTAKQATEVRLNDALYDLEMHNKKLSDMSQTDELTGLYNRRGFVSLGQQSMQLAVRMNKNGMVVFSDMDGLKVINDTWGHDTGDRAIVAMAFVLKKTFRSLDIIARLGGDEFAIVAVDVNNKFIKTLRERMNRFLKVYNESSKEPFTLSISIGAVDFSAQQNSNLEKLLSKADSVLYEEKRKKKEKLARKDGESGLPGRQKQK